MDRAIYKVPASDAHPDHLDYNAIHWDTDPRSPGPLEVQGMVFLTDAPVDQGPFLCVPSLFADLDGWLAAHPDRGIEDLGDLDGHEVVSVPLEAGDLLIWDVRLPHAGGANRGRAPRLSVPIRMYREGGESERRERIRCWKQRRAPKVWRGWKGQLDPEPGAPAELTGLGRKLLGLDRWP
jgi:ectoine hydroxylase-related dioxygenase (phytanoyl-CoA dioxygenase family)